MLSSLPNECYALKSFIVHNRSPVEELPSGGVAISVPDAAWAYAAAFPLQWDTPASVSRVNDHLVYVRLSVGDVQGEIGLGILSREADKLLAQRRVSLVDANRTVELLAGPLSTCGELIVRNGSESGKPGRIELKAIEARVVDPKNEDLFFGVQLPVVHDFGSVRVRISSGGAGALPLLGLRLVVTLPAVSSFAGCDLDIARDNIDALRELGAVVCEFDTSSFVQNDQSTLQEQVKAIRDFRADAVIGQPNAGYALMINKGDLPRAEGTLGNLFFETLDLPTILIWDQVIPQSAKYVSGKWPASPVDSTSGMLGLLRTLLNHPRTYHFISDPGHVAELRRLGVSEVGWEAACVCPISNKFGGFGQTVDANSFQRDVAFFGNIYAAASRERRQENLELAAVRQAVFEACMADWNCSPYHAYVRALGRLSEETRARLRLNPDESFYWQFLYDELSFAANGDLRFRKLASCGRPLTWIGGFADPPSRQIADAAGWTLQDEYLEYGQPLAQGFRQTRVTVDVVNAPFIDGFSASKILACYAAGGFMLSDRKKGILAALSPYGDAISYSSAGELAHKVDRYLTYERERNELAGELSALVQREYTNSAFYARAIPFALDCLASR